jgi:hypothetical protein
MLNSPVRKIQNKLLVYCIGYPVLTRWWNFTADFDHRPDLCIVICFNVCTVLCHKLIAAQSSALQRLILCLSFDRTVHIVNSAASVYSLQIYFYLINKSKTIN